MASTVAARARQTAAATGAATALDEGQEHLLWSKLREAADGTARHELLQRHLPYARVVAASYFAKRSHDEVEFDDYLQLATIGLLEAMDRYDPGRGAQFRTFAARRMHGAILNGLEKLTEKQQQIVARQRLRAERMEAVKQMASENASGSKQAEQLVRYMADVGVGLALSWILEGTSMIDGAERSESVPFYRSTEVRQLRERLLRCIGELPPQEREVIRCHYLQEIPFERIASMQNLTRGRISQVHKQAILRLRQALRDDGGLDMRL